MMSNLTNQYLLFNVSSQHFAIAIHYIREIMEYENVSPLPNMPKEIIGAINLRGQIIPIINLASRFNLDFIEWTNRTCIIRTEVMSNNTVIHFGIKVDMVNQVIQVDESDIAPAPTLGEQINYQSFIGVLEINGELVSIIDTPKIIKLNDLESQFANNIEQMEVTK